MDTGQGRLEQFEAKFPDHGAVFTEGEIVDVKGSKFQITRITPKKLFLRIMPRDIQDEKFGEKTKDRPFGMGRNGKAFSRSTIEVGDEIFCKCGGLISIAKERILAGQPISGHCFTLPDGRPAVDGTKMICSTCKKTPSVWDVGIRKPVPAKGEAV